MKKKTKNKNVFHVLLNPPKTYINEINSVGGVFSNLLLQLIFPVIDGDGVVVPIQSMNKGLKTWETLTCKISLC